MFKLSRLIYIYIYKKVFKLLLNENKLKGLIRQVIKEMAHSFGGIHPVGGIKYPKDDITSPENVYGVQKNRNSMTVAAYDKAVYDKFQTQLDWRLKNYPGCNIYTCMFPSNLDIDDIFKNNHLFGTGESRIKDLLSYDTTLSRAIDITDRIEDIIAALSESLDENDPSVQKLFNTLRESTRLANNDKNGVLIYLGPHTNDMADPPTAFNMLHQVIDSDHFQTFDLSHELYQALDDIKLPNGLSLLELERIKLPNGNEKTQGAFEGRALSRSSDYEVVWSLILMALGWLDPDTCTILSDNPTNPGLAGSSDPHDIIKRCLAPMYKNNEELIEEIVSVGVSDMLCQCVGEFWNMFRGRVILTFSSRV